MGYNEELIRIIKARAAELGLSMRKVSFEVTGKYDFVRKLKTVKDVKHKNLKKLARVLDMPEGVLSAAASGTIPDEPISPDQLEQKVDEIVRLLAGEHGNTAHTLRIRRLALDFVRKIATEEEDEDGR